MGLRHFRTNVAVRVVLVALNAGALALLVFRTAYLFTSIAAALLLLVQGLLLFRFVDKNNRVLTRFFEAINAADFSQNMVFPEGASFAGLKTEYLKTMEMLRGLNLERERLTLYSTAIAQSINVGVLIFDQGGAVDFCNQAFRDVLGATRPLRSLADLASANLEFHRTITTMRNGEKGLFRTDAGADRLVIWVRDLDSLAAEVPACGRSEHPEGDSKRTR